MRILIAGLGSIGRRHLRALRSIGQDDLLLLRTSSEALPEAPDLPVYTDIESALAQDPDLMIVANPAPFHIQTALRAATAGVHLFIEKPLSNTWEKVTELAEVVRNRGLVAAVGFDLRFDEGLKRAHDLLEQGYIGRVLSVHAEVGQYLPDWRPGTDYRGTVTARSELGGGVILELCHELDYVDWLAGPVEETACVAQKVSDLEMDSEDVAEIVGRSARGCLISIHLDCVQLAPVRRCKLIGSKGTIVIDFLNREVRSTRAGEQSRAVWRHTQSRDGRFREQMQHVLACVRGEESPRVPLERGIEVLALTMAVKMANETGRACPVACPE